MKKIYLVFIFILFAYTSIFVGAFNYVPYKDVNGVNIKHRGTNIDVMISDTYLPQDRDFRAVWVSHLVSDFPSYANVEQYKGEIQEVLNTMEYFKMNAIIFHIRTHNNALYKSEINPVASYYKNVNFDEFDPLEYIIEESHKRGIEFHAWLNPYRLSTTFSGTTAEFAAMQPSVNIASNPEMILKSGKNLILNPGEPDVRDFIIDSVMEVMENYDVDAIHFDDYFYISGIDDSKTRLKYNTEQLSIDNFRRKQVDLFIEQLYEKMQEFNLENNKVVQLGISPSGIYRNGSYVPLEDYIYDDAGKLVYPEFSSTSGFSHYDSYLYSDTKRWIDNNWIDYIIPQSYWAFEQGVAPFADVMDWWDMALRYSKVNLYSGMGLYKAATYSESDGWYTSVNQAIDQVKYNSALESVRGHSIFSYRHLKWTKDNEAQNQVTKAFSKVKDQAWTDITLLPEIRTFTKVSLGEVQNLEVNKVAGKNIISFEKLAKAKFYVLYRDEENVNFSNEQIIKIFGSEEDLITYTDDVNGDFEYGVKPLSYTNTLGEGNKEYSGSVYKIDFYADDVLVATFNSRDTISLPSIPSKVGFDEVAPTWSHTNFSNLTADLRVDANYVVNIYEVKFYDKNGELLDTVLTTHGLKAAEPTPPKLAGFKFKKWDRDLENITEDIEVNPIYEEIEDKEASLFSCVKLDYNLMLFFLGFALFIFGKRRKQ